MENYRELIDEIDKTEKHFDSQINKIIKHATGEVKADSYQIYLLIKREMDLTILDSEKIHDMWKQVIYRVFNDSLIQTLKDKWSNDDEEFKYDPYLSSVHPIFGKTLNLFTMPCQDGN